jgi:hypothetical protein
MGWERGYYYRAKKVNGRVVNEYVGPGMVGANRGIRFQRVRRVK